MLRCVIALVAAMSNRRIHPFDDLDEERMDAGRRMLLGGPLGGLLPHGVIRWMLEQFVSCALELASTSQVKPADQIAPI